MAVRARPKPESAEGESQKMRLMDHQANLSPAKGATVMMSVRLPIDLKEQMAEFSAEHNISMTTLIIEGINWRMSQDF